jgi:hypothetical protein
VQGLSGLGSFDCVAVRFAGGDFAQDDRALLERPPLRGQRAAALATWAEDSAAGIFTVKIAPPSGLFWQVIWPL